MVGAACRAEKAQNRRAGTAIATCSVASIHRDQGREVWWRCTMPANPTHDEKDRIEKPSQAEGERNQPGEDKHEEHKDKEFPEPAKPSQAEGERKPYT